MNHFSFELSLVAMLPALLLCGYVFYKDRIEKEPVGLLAILFGVGAAVYIPAFFGQNLIIKLIDSAFANDMQFSAEGIVSFSSEGKGIAHIALCSFFGYSVIQICLKWCALFFITHKNKNFNYLFDGIVYSTFLSLGFAVAENVHFVIQNGWELLGAKLLTSVPCHLFVGILMGYYYTMWHARFVANGIENDMLKAGIVKEDKVKSSAVWLLSSLLIPVALNGAYIFAGSFGDDSVALLFYTAVFVLYGISFIVIDRIAARDSSSARYLCRIIAKGHPELPCEKIEKIVAEGISDSAQEDVE